jgi:predicted secreted Zn-dependent protease
MSRWVDGLTRSPRVLLGAAVILSACGSSSAKPVPPPAPAPGPAASITPDKVALESQEQYYDIEGSSVGALREQISRLGPTDGGEPRDALTVWTIDWTYAESRTPDGCGLRNVQVTLTLNTTLPRWAPPAGTPAPLVQSWQRYLGAVKRHEAGHRAIAEQNARDLLAALLALRGASCREVWDAASRTAERVVADGRARNRAYDVETKHGQTQGVQLGP